MMTMQDDMYKNIVLSDNKQERKPLHDLNSESLVKRISRSRHESNINSDTVNEMAPISHGKKGMKSKEVCNHDAHRPLRRKNLSHHACVTKRKCVDKKCLSTKEAFNLQATHAEGGSVNKCADVEQKRKHKATMNRASSQMDDDEDGYGVDAKRMLQYRVVRRKYCQMEHNDTHDTMPSFYCLTCDKSFPERDHLVEHMRVHYGELYFTCTQCQKRFAEEMFSSQGCQKSVSKM